MIAPVDVIKADLPTGSSQRMKSRRMKTLRLVKGGEEAALPRNIDIVAGRIAEARARKKEKGRHTKRRSLLNGPAKS
jgi:hypothetical protein